MLALTITQRINTSVFVFQSKGIREETSESTVNSYSQLLSIVLISLLPPLIIKRHFLIVAVFLQPPPSLHWIRVLFHSLLYHRDSPRSNEQGEFLVLLQEMTKFSNGVQRVNELTRQARDYSRTQQSIRRSRRGITGSDCIWQNAKDYLSTVTSMPAQEAPGLYRPMMSMRLSYYPNTCSSSLMILFPLVMRPPFRCRIFQPPYHLKSRFVLLVCELEYDPQQSRGPFPTINLTTTPLNSSLKNALPPVDNHPSVSVAVTTTSLESDATGPSSVPSQPLQTPSQSLSARSQPLSQPVSVLSQPVSTSFQPVSTPSRPFSSSRSYSRPGSSSSASSHPASSEASLNNIPMGPPSHRLVEPPKGSFMSISAKSLANAMNSVPHARARATDVTLQKKKREAYLSGSILQGERRTTMFMTDSPSQASDDHDSILSNDVLPPVHEESHHLLNTSKFATVFNLNPHSLHWS